MSSSEPPRPRRPRPDLKQLYDSLQPSEPVRPKVLTNGIGMAFVFVPAGTFRMGSPEAEPGHRVNEAPAHEVVLTKPYYLATGLVTQLAFQAVMRRNPAFFTADRGGTPDHPVERVTWEDAAGFCERLGDRPDERAAGRRYRLPTEAEWEHAARAGTDTPFPFGETFTTAHGTFDARHPYPETAAAGEPADGPTPAGRFPANAFGLHDLCGNLWEWCADWYDQGYYATAPVRDPSGPPTGTRKVIRGGSWKNHGHTCRVAYRNALPSYQKNSATGFRVVLEVA